MSEQDHLSQDREPLKLTSNAAKRIIKILSDEPQGSQVRLRVDGGGCSGFQYHFDITTTGEADDLVLEKDGAILRVDSLSLPLIEGLLRLRHQFLALRAKKALAASATALADPLFASLRFHHSQSSHIDNSARCDGGR